MKAVELTAKLKEAGFSISLDDFGSKYSNLAILATMEFDEVKFDRSLVSMLEENEKKQSSHEEWTWIMPCTKRDYLSCGRH